MAGLGGGGGGVGAQAVRAGLGALGYHICLRDGTNNGPARGVVTTPADHFTPAYMEASMHYQGNQETTARQARRERLTEIVLRLGKDATAAQIREEAYRVGLGALNARMLTMVRSKVWPDRIKRSQRGPGNVADPEVLALITCPSCGGIATYTKDVKRSGPLFKRSHVCRACNHKYITVSDKQLVNRSVTRNCAAAALTEKKCTACQVVLPIGNFTKRGSDTELYRPVCKACTNHKRRTSYGTRSIQRQYGISLAQYERMLTLQGYKCAICGREEDGNRYGRRLPLCVDHCHTTNRVRGLLCNRCNLGIGNFDDDVDRLQAAVAYIRRNETGNTEPKGEHHGRTG